MRRSHTDEEPILNREHTFRMQLNPIQANKEAREGIESERVGRDNEEI